MATVYDIWLRKTTLHFAAAKGPVHHLHGAADCADGVEIPFCCCISAAKKFSWVALHSPTLLAVTGELLVSTDKQV